jgi:nitric oxide reductase NorE protein
VSASGVTIPPGDPAPAGLRLPGEAGIWVFIAGDLAIFSLFFLTYLYYRGEDVALFAASQQQLSLTCGTINTVLMLTSSWLVASAVHAVRLAQQGIARACLLLAIGCGAGFGIVKVFEYGEKIRAGLTLNSNDFYISYYMLTGIHLLHVLIGTGVLMYLYSLVVGGRRDSVAIRNIESGASFWHVVDVLWIVLFALLYLTR